MAGRERDEGIREWIKGLIFTAPIQIHKFIAAFHCVISMFKVCTVLFHYDDSWNQRWNL